MTIHCPHYHRITCRFWTRRIRKRAQEVEGRTRVYQASHRSDFDSMDRLKINATSRSTCLAFESSIHRRVYGVDARRQVHPE